MGKVVVFANQKGGVGKSTLSILYANHLTNDDNRKPLLLIEFDIQKSISFQRKNDLSSWEESLVNYNVEYYELKDSEDSARLMTTFKKDTDAIILIDLPGNITNDYVAPILIMADYIICPFQYENKVLESTTTFIKVLGRLKDAFGNQMIAKTLFVPNRIDSRRGTRNDLINQRKVDEIMSKYGEVMSKIPDRVDFERINTIFNTKVHEELCFDCFQQIDRYILG